MLTILLVDAELELIPKEMWDDHSIIKLAKLRKKPVREIILDSNYMHTAIDRYYNGGSRRMGRPDIIYNFLQVCMESILNKKGELKIYIHTKGDKIISFNPEIKLPKSYNRFIGLIEDLYKKKEIKSEGKTLMKISDGTFQDLLGTAVTGNLSVLSPTGNPTLVSNLFAGYSEQTVIIGGFSEGDYSSDVYSSAKAYRIFDEELTIWTTAMEIIAQYERDNKIVQ